MPIRPPDPRGPCGNEECPRCYPHQRYFRVSTDTIERLRHERTIMADSPEAALAAYAQGTAWPSDYDTRTLETIERSPTQIEEVQNPNLSDLFDDGVVTWTCYWDLPDR